MYLHVLLPHGSKESKKVTRAWRYAGVSFAGKYQVLTFEEYIAIALNANRVVGIYPEIKSPVFVNRHVSLLATHMNFTSLIGVAMHPVFFLYSCLTRTRLWLSFPYGRSNGPGAKHMKTSLLRHCWSMVTRGSIYQRSGKSSLYLYNLLHPLLSSRPPSSRTRHWSFWLMAPTNSLKILIRWVTPFMPCFHNCMTYLKLARIWSGECSSCWSGCKICRLSARLRLMNTSDSSASMWWAWALGRTQLHPLIPTTILPNQLIS